MLRQREDMEARLSKIRAKEKAQRDAYRNGDQAFKKRKTGSEKKDDDGDDDDEQFILDDYDSDHEKSTPKIGAATGYSAATLELMGRLGMGATALQEEDAEVEDETKVCHHISVRYSCLIATGFLLFPNTFTAHSVRQ